VLNDLTVGKYDITVNAGPSYDTMRQESAEFFIAAMQSAKDPATASVVTYLAMKNQDVPGGEEATAMLKKLLPPGIAEDEEENPEMVMTSKGPVPVQQAGMIIDQMEQQMQQIQPMLDQKAQEFQQQEQELKDLRTELENQALKLNYEKQLMKANESFTKQLVQAQEMAADAQQKATLTEAIAQVESIVADYKDQVEQMLEMSKAPQENGEDQRTYELESFMQQHHNQMMDQLNAVVQPLIVAMSRPQDDTQILL